MYLHLVFCVVYCVITADTHARIVFGAFYSPDHVSLTPDNSKAVVSCEGDDDATGGLSVIDVTPEDLSAINAVTTYSVSTCISTKLYLCLMQIDVCQSVFLEI